MSDNNSLEHYLFGPLDKRYCLLFYIFSVIMYLMFVLAVIGIIVGLFKGIKMTALQMFFSAYSLLILFVSYLTQRLLYSMCVTSGMK
jgi:hypothetical protein